MFTCRILAGCIFLITDKTRGGDMRGGARPGVELLENNPESQSDIEGEGTLQ